jgi:cytochrome c oxidase subunit 2
MSGFVCRRLHGGCKAKEAATKADDPAKVWELVDLKVRGEGLRGNCVACHQATGKGVGDQGVGRFWRSCLMRTTTNKSILLNGAGGGAMPAWKSLSDTDLRL